MEDIVGTKKCLICGAEFGVTKINKHQKYCCRACNQKARRDRNKTTYNKICVVCGKEFSTTKNQIKTCSDKCTREHKNQMNKERYKSKKKKSARTLNCIICGKEFTTNHARAKTCSKECSAENNRMLANKNYIPGNPKRRDGLECVVCGTKFIPVGRQIYCSVKCRKDGFARPHPMNKPRECRACGIEFMPTSSGQWYCKPNCKKSKPRVRKRTPSKKIDMYTPTDYGFVESQKTIIEHDLDMKQAYMEFKRRQLAGVI